MKKRNIRQVVFPLLASMIWGAGFVVQSISTEKVPTFVFNTSRSAIAFLSLLLLYSLRGKSGKAAGGTDAEGKEGRKDALIGGAVCGLFLTVSLGLQQWGLQYTSSGKAGFITTFYVVLVPLIGFFLHRRVSRTVGISVVITMVGLYCLCVTRADSFSVNRGDLAILFCAFVFSWQVYAIDYYVQKVDEVLLSCLQFGFTAIFSGLIALCCESVEPAALLECLPNILYMGVFASGVAYTLQIFAQKDGNPAVVSLLISLESFFSLVFGAILLHERLSAREYLGCLLMLIAVVLSQRPEKNSKSVEREQKV